jgi:enoyl-CoA hydratase/carnithine racemase
MSEVVLCDRVDGAAVITLNRPDALNAISTELAAALIEAIEGANRDPKIKGMVLTGAGDKAFCAGVDLQQARAMSVDRIEEWFGLVCSIYTTILNTDKPFVIALNGIAAGGGFQMALVSDLRVGHSQTRMGQPEINAGIPSVMGAYWMTLHVGWSVNQELSYTGRLMSAEECQQLGLLNYVVDADQIVDVSLGLVSDMAHKPATAFLRTKQRFREVAMRGFDDAFRAGVLGQQAAYANGEPQAIIDDFMAERARRKTER